MRHVLSAASDTMDGGGSTAMAVNGRIANVTSDTTGERAVGGTIQVAP
ncbi:hypothetical protein AB0B92_00980 [Streptomyces hygroscopicus]